MSPKGGIKPHRRFGVQSKRSEVLFVDYIAEHLTPAGRAGIIVPEGIIFQSQASYTALRKMLVTNHLVAVISLPAGVFNPYSGVKTSVLILDRSLARKSSTIAFFKVENDGFGLGAQRRAMLGSELAQVKTELGDYLQAVRTGQPIDELQPTLGLIVEKTKIAASGDYNLSGEHYSEQTLRTAVYPRTPLLSIAEIAAGNPAPQGEEFFASGNFPFVRTSDVGRIHLSDDFRGTNQKVNQKAVDDLHLRLFPAGTILFPKSGASTFLNHRVVLGEAAYVSSHLGCIICAESKALPKFVYILLCQIDARSITVDQAYPSLRLTDIGEIQIPLPPLDVQKEIVAEIDGYQKVINGARAVLDNYRPHIPIHPDWPLVRIGEHFTTSSGGTPSRDEPSFWIGEIPWVSPKDMKADEIIDTEDHICDRAIERSATKLFPAQSVVCVVRSGILKHTFPMALLSRPMCINQDLIAFQTKTGAISSQFLFYVLKTKSEEILSRGIKPGVTVQSFHNGFFRDYLIPLPPAPIQQAIVAEIEAEQALVAANRDLISRFEQKIQATIARVWGETDA